MSKKYVTGIDISNGITTHVEGYMENGILYIKDTYEIIDGVFHENIMPTPMTRRDTTSDDKSS